MNKKLIIFALLGFGAVYVLRKLNMSKQIVTQVMGISLGNGGLLLPQVIVTVLITNPTSTTADVQKIQGTLSTSDGNIFGSINYNTTTTISGNANTKIDIPIDLSSIDVATTLMTQGFQNQTINFNGKMVVDFIPVPLNFTYKF